MKKRLLSMLMAVLMIVSLVPAVALADTNTCTHKNTTEFVVEKNATEKQPGIYAKVCADCGAVLDKDGKVTTNVVTPFALKRDYCKVCTNPVVKEFKATCTEGGLTVTYCGTCGQQMALKSVAKTGCVYSVDSFTVVVAPTCKGQGTDGWGYAVCDVCGTPVYADATNAANLLTKGDMTDKAYEAAQKKVVDLFAAFDHVTADKAVAVTETTYNDDGSVKYQAEVKPTHVATVGLPEGKLDGVTFTIAKNCYVDANGVIVDAHRTDIKDVKMLTGKGFTATKLCPDCGDVLVKSGDVPSCNYSHWKSMTVLKTGVAPEIDPEDGALIDGVTDKIFCAECGKTFGGDVISAASYFAPEAKLPAIGDTKVATKDGEENIAGVQGKLDATCCTEGWTGDTLAYVQTGVNAKGEAVGQWILLKKGEKIEKLAHNYVALESKAATCTENGVKYVGISVCKNVVDTKEDGTPIYCYQQNAKVGEGFKLAKINNAKVERGVVKDYGETLDKAHVEKVEKVLVEATCQHTGLNALVCSACGAYLLDENYDNDDNAYVTAKVNHVAADERANVVEATCTEAGYTGDVVCKWCGTVLEKGEEVPALGHKTEVKDAKAATCTEAGYTGDEVCTVCGETVKKGTEIPALGHKFENGVCTVCGAADPNYVVPNPFKDVEKTSPYYDAIIWAAKEEITTGKTADTFGIDEGCTRAQIVTFLYRAAGSPEVKADTVNPFTDVSKDSVYYNAILWAVENGITKGTTDTTFDPNAVCTRGQIVTFLFRASGDEKVATGTNFADVASGSYCADAVAWAVANDVTNGFADGTFRPEATCTRGQAVTFIYRALAE